MKGYLIKCFAIYSRVQQLMTYKNIAYDSTYLERRYGIQICQHLKVKTPLYGTCMKPLALRKSQWKMIRVVQCLKIYVEDQDVNLLSEQLVSSKHVLDVLRFFEASLLIIILRYCCYLLDYLHKLVMEGGVKSRVFVSCDFT
jgi:hypothetical protein